MPLNTQLGTIVHEAMHHGGFDTTEVQAESVVQCLQNANQDEDADDDNGGGGGGGGLEWLSPGMLQNCEVYYEDETSCITVSWETGGLQEWCVMVDYADWGGGVEEVCVTDDDGDGYFSIRTCSYTGYSIQVCTGAQSMASTDGEMCVTENNGIWNSQGSTRGAGRLIRWGTAKRPWL